MCEGYADLGFPIVEVSSNGDIEVTKPDGTGGLLNKNTIAEQILYEIGDPAAYTLPDVVCDFTNVNIEEVQSDLIVVLKARTTHK